MVTVPPGPWIAAEVSVSATTERPWSNQTNPVWSYRLRDE
jgi:hypothetical protein